MANLRLGTSLVVGVGKKDKVFSGEKELEISTWQWISTSDMTSVKWVSSRVLRELQQTPYMEVPYQRN